MTSISNTNTYYEQLVKTIKKYIEDCQKMLSIDHTSTMDFLTRHVKIDLNEKLDPKQNAIQKFNIDSHRFRKIKNENPLTWEMGVTS